MICVIFNHFFFIFYHFFGGYTHNAQKIRIAGMAINSPLWIIYDIIVGSWAGILDEVVSEISMAISIWRYGWKELGETQE